MADTVSAVLHGHAPGLIFVLLLRTVLLILVIKQQFGMDKSGTCLRANLLPDFLRMFTRKRM